MENITIKEAFSEARAAIKEDGKSNMTRAEASHLRNKHGKNYNGGKYDTPNAADNPMLLVKIAASMAIIVFLLSSG